MLQRLREPIRTPVGVDLYYGISFGSGPTIYNHGPRPAAPEHRPVLRAAFSPAGYATLDFTTPAVAVSSSLSAQLGARAFASHRRYFGLTTGPEAIAAGTPVSYYQYEVAPTLSSTALGEHLSIDVGPVFKYTRLRSPAGVGGQPNLLAADLGYRPTGSVSQLGLRADALVQAVSRGPNPTAGVRMGVGGTAYAPIWGLERPLTEVHAEVEGFVRLPAPTSPTLHLRAGGRKLWGDVPLHELAYLGGADVFRGVSRDRFGGSMLTYGGAELHVPVVRLTALGRQVRLGIAGLIDVGRIGHTDSPGSGWMTAYGGGVWIQPGQGAATLSAGMVGGPLGPRFYLRTGIGF
jgi:hypothetical protein